MAKRVVYRFEIIEVEAHDNHGFVLFSDALEAFGHLFPEHQPVRQIGKGVMARHMGDILFGPITLGDVLVSAHPTAAGHRLMPNGDNASIGKVPHQRRFFIFNQSFGVFGKHLLGIAAGRMNAAGDAAAHQLDQGRAGPRIFGVELVKF